MSTFRRIIVKEKEYLWKYSYDDNDYQNVSSLIVKSIDKKGKLIIYFKTKTWDQGYCPFNQGIPAKLKNKQVVINLNQPHYVEELIVVVLDKSQINDLIGTVVIDDGIQLFHDLGYDFEYQKTWDNSTVKF